eukprot:jgi/Psemu1/15177/gm1.15177_g
MVKNPSWVGHKSRVSNYSKTEVVEFLHTLKAILPIEVFQTSIKSTPLFTIKKIPTGDPNFPEEVQLAKRIKCWLIKTKFAAGDGEEEYHLEEGYKNNNMEEEEEHSNNISSQNTNISSEDEDSDGDDIPPIPLSNTANPTNATAASSTFPTNLRTRTQYTNHHKHTTLLGPRDNTGRPTDARKFDFLRESSELEREQRRENHQLKREYREAVFEAERQQREAALESLKATIVDVATIFVNQLRPNSNSNYSRANGVFDRDGSDFDSGTLKQIK